MKLTATISPLEIFYTLENNQPPLLKEVSGEMVPEPQRSLLVHKNDMTPTLQSFYQHPINLSVKKLLIQEKKLLRKVVLTANEGQPVLFGAICIYLDLLPGAAQEMVVACRRPLGEILSIHKVPHSSRPEFFFKVDADTVMQEALAFKTSHELYGRVNRLLNPQQEALVEVIEIMPPVIEN